MRYVRFSTDTQTAWGVLTADDHIQPLTAAPYQGGVATGATIAVSAVRLRAPCQPSKIVAVGKNYLDHVKEFDAQVPETPILFIKPNTCVNDPDGTIPLPAISKQVDYEGELALVISRTASQVSAAEASQYILGYTILNDVTARDLQKQDGQWTRAKSFDGFAPVGPYVSDEVAPQDLAIETRLNGKIVQQSTTALQIWPVYELIAFITQVMTLLPGDVVTTGTPSGVGPMQAGDVVEVSITGLGVLRNRLGE